VRFTLENRSGWDTKDLARFFARGLRALGVRKERLIIVVASPIRSRGCAEIGEKTYGQRLREGEAVVIAMAPPSRFSLRRLARLFEHEVTHTKGFEHEEMPERVLWSLGGIPSWAKGTPLRYRGRAPGQLPR
jgi:hypothetical protein